MPIALIGIAVTAWTTLAASKEPSGAQANPPSAAAASATSSAPAPAAAVTPSAPSPAAAAPTLAECLVGRWEVSTVATTVTIPVHDDHTAEGHTVDMTLTGGKILYTIGPSSGYVEFEDAVLQGTHEGHSYYLRINGRRSYSWSVRSGRVTARDISRQGRVQFYHGDDVVVERDLGSGEGPHPLGSCVADQAALRWPAETQQLVRLSAL